MENDELFFCGDFSHALDPQFRVTLPSAWRCGEGDPHLVLFPGRDHDLLLFPYAMFREFLIRARSSALANPAAQVELCDRILVLCAGKVSGIVPGRNALKRDLGMMMTNHGGSNNA